MTSGRVLVTGGSGYIASFVIAALLKEGCQVRTTVRNVKRQDEVRAAIGQLADASKLEFAAADLNSDAGWADAVKDCSYVIHVASPLPSNNPKDDEELIKPARDGALRVLKAARDAGVKRVVMTSSSAAINYGYGGSDKAYTEADWSSPDDRSDSSGYERSKMIAERAAWDWLKREGGALELVTVCPGAVLGPVLGTNYSASIDIVKKLIDGSLPGIPRFGWPLVDVRDIAALHVLAMKSPQAASQRYAGAEPFFWMSDIADVLRARVPEVARRVPKMRLPDWVVRVSSIVDPVVRGRLFELGKRRAISSDKAKRELGWQPRSNGDTIVDTARSLIDKGIVRVGRG